ncbi:thioredoxin reductase (NADPH) [Kribbella orskensis]|uniref:Thioredoxin reductase (NADPH) n=1 Tax=Kribbella orskensis TaxID=2512216 RepID=A0ABY2BFC3_9ACTN|nr:MULTISPECIES: FAD-dependent oxidoreductase [Kribbella]TCN35475.1 thioredoxin reductase (NADPH) [Kribbella sp. VKM Ac-2500]TCO17017.1 thioredoxin reductase (NADPH) [Kribbella orskensis]
MSTVTSGPASLVRVFGRPMDPASYVLRDFLSRSVAQYTWTELATDHDCIRALGVPLDGVELPVVQLPGGERLEAPDPETLAKHLGWVVRPSTDVYDLSIYGAGPAGLSAAVYAASEGLRVAVIERNAVGGQAGSSSLIENYLGFPTGISGAELAERARQQAVRFGAELLQMRAGLEGAFTDGLLRVNLSDGSVMASRSNICATGVRWRRLGLDDEEKFFGAGLYYGSGIGEAPQCAGQQVVVVGGANSAGQTTMNLSQYAEKVTLLVRGLELSRNMSAYLVDRIAAQPNVEVRTGTTIRRLVGGREIMAIDLQTGDRATVEVPATRVFVCIGGEANTEWAEDSDLILDEHGLFLTGNDLSPAMLEGTWWLDRRPFDLETNVPGFFAIGDVRKGSIKRVASAVGEGALAVSYVHRFLAGTDSAT